MVTPTAGAIVLVRFPFSDLSQAKLRPAVVLVDAGRGDWILCQVTSKPYGDAQAIALDDASFATFWPDIHPFRIGFWHLGTYVRSNTFELA